MEEFLLFAFVALYLTVSSLCFLALLITLDIG